MITPLGERIPARGREIPAEEERIPAHGREIPANEERIPAKEK